MKISRPRGTNDFLPAETVKWQHLENILKEVSCLYGFYEIRTPIFEHTELFQRGVGETTDIVEKEMYTFSDRKKRSITLRPEGTASVVRAYLENKLYASGGPVKFYYTGPMFRYDRPQAGRYRQFHQYGVEFFGVAEPAADAEIIILAEDILERLGIDDLEVSLNSVGCPACRPKYYEKLKAYFADREDQLCDLCRSRLSRNPLRVFDCKNSSCQAVAAGAPKVADNLCAECEGHFSELKAILDVCGVKYSVDDFLVRGLDYYTKTAFEILYNDGGTMKAVCGGGRYDNLVEQCGGKPVPGIGFALGMERILQVLEEKNLIAAEIPGADIYAAYVGRESMGTVFGLMKRLRKCGYAVETDYSARSLGSQLKNAARMKVPYALIVGDDEIREGVVEVKDMTAGTQEKVAVAEIENYFKGRMLND